MPLFMDVDHPCFSFSYGTSRPPPQFQELKMFEVLFSLPPVILTLGGHLEPLFELISGNNSNKNILPSKIINIKTPLFEYISVY